MSLLRKTSLAERGKTIAYQISADSKAHKHFDRLMKEGKDWIGELTDKHGPFSGYELHEFLYWYQKALKSKPKNKEIPQAYEPRPKPLGKIEINEGNINPEGSIVINKTDNVSYGLNPIEKSTNLMCKQEGEIKFGFKAKQRYQDITGLLHTYKGNPPSHEVLNLPERESEEIAKPPPISVPEKYEAFLLEEVLLPPVASQNIAKSKQDFVTSFSLPDSMTRKAIVAREKAGEIGTDEFVDVTKHKFREEYNPKDIGKEDFILRLPKPQLSTLELLKDSTDTETVNKKQLAKEQEETEALRRTTIGNKSRPEFMATFKPVHKSLEIGTQSPHKLLFQGKYVDPLLAMSREDDLSAF